VLPVAVGVDDIQAIELVVQELIALAEPSVHTDVIDRLTLKDGNRGPSSRMIRRNGAPLLISTVQSPESEAARPPRVAATCHVSVGTASIAPTHWMATCAPSSAADAQVAHACPAAVVVDLDGDAQLGTDDRPRRPSTARVDISDRGRARSDP
jgi:hypothetical protein